MESSKAEVDAPQEEDSKEEEVRAEVSFIHFLSARFFTMSYTVVSRPYSVNSSARSRFRTQTLLHQIAVSPTSVPQQVVKHVKLTVFH